MGANRISMEFRMIELLQRDNVIRFPVERTEKAKQDEAMRVYEAARAAWYAAHGTVQPTFDGGY
jgi:hypothetical protein